MRHSAFETDWFSRPGDTLSNLMATKNVSLATFAEQASCDPTYIRDLLAGYVPIDGNLAAMISKYIGGSPDFWIKRQQRFEQDLDRAASSISLDELTRWSKSLPLKQIVQSRAGSKISEKFKVAQSLLLYFDVATVGEWQERYARFDGGFAFRTSASFKSKIGALAVWLREGELAARTVDCATWAPQKMRAQLDQIRILTKAKAPSYFIPRLCSLCAEAGVAVVFVRAPDGCRASGAARFLSANKALIILSFRHLSDDHFWFTFFHEVGHLLLHNPASTFIDEEVGSQTAQEREANEFAARTLIPGNKAEDLVRLRTRPRDVIRFAISVGVSPGIVVGQLQHMDLLPKKTLNRLKRRYSWQEIELAIS